MRWLTPRGAFWITFVYCLTAPIAILAGALLAYRLTGNFWIAMSSCVLMAISHALVVARGPDLTEALLRPYYDEKYRQWEEEFDRCANNYSRHP